MKESPKSALDTNIKIERKGFLKIARNTNVTIQWKWILKVREVQM